ncbi:hypothetical protein [Thermogemmatispora tikiterensis]|uniref:Uncharacterized protein n=1 Tax=Thermogemmatispora tikiterensis TaxID=1825093 RepID=A0A328VJ74_9CHLR|nr:hypothetical protein [Thermogemmatispora tikiterensis]RAQ97726.1 hypothetical protein A4R35_19460 [Thermogemmatispora tikiterensis]
MSRRRPSPQGRQPRRPRRRSLLAGMPQFPLATLVEWVLAGRLLAELQEQLFAMLSPSGQACWEHWLQTQEVLWLQGRMARQLSESEQGTLCGMREIEEVLRLLERRCQQAMASQATLLVYFTEPEIHQIRWLLGLVESFLRRSCRGLKARDLPLELRVGRSLLRRLGRTLRDQPRRESLN